MRRRDKRRRRVTLAGPPITRRVSILDVVDYLKATGWLAYAHGFTSGPDVVPSPRREDWRIDEVIVLIARHERRSPGVNGAQDARKFGEDRGSPSDLFTK